MRPSSTGFGPRLGAWGGAICLTAALLGSCGSPSEPPAPQVAPQPSAAAPAPSAAEPPAPTPERSTHAAILDPEALRAVESLGFGLAEVLFAKPASSADELAKTGFATILDTLKGDVERTLQAHPTARVSSVLGTRLFDARWLHSKEMRFELVGVFNRLDRKVFYDGSCGELRFIYRLAYSTLQGGEPMHGRLPLTVNVVFLVDDAGGCAAAAERWRSPVGLSPKQAASWLVDEGALSSASRASWTLKAVETNLQTVRVQSTAHPTLGGHIEYSLRVFHPTDASRSAFVPAPMDNLPDVEKLEQDASLRDDLIKTLRDPEVLRAIDEGTLRLPARFLATHGLSVAPRGLGRAGNRPFSQILRDADLEGLELSALKTISSKKALLRRLDGLTCVGCHQSRSIAGFHHVGDDAASDPAWSSLVRGSSSHLLADLERREGYVTAIARGEAPPEMRPHAERQGQAGGFGAPCGLGDPGFAAWKCGAGLRCVQTEDADVGVCLDDAKVGAPCELGSMLAGPSPKKDFVRYLAQTPCGKNLGCSPNINGFPQGACAGHCGNGLPNEACIDFVDIDGLQACLRVGKTAAYCGERYVVERADRACDATHPCRQDFVCARAGDASKGACVPPYFVFGLRADGYPIK
ncbi:MAG: hypothetical protein IPM79_01055 [Polyangiaceae bacterium]|nr:hypothetical protein [Polyangiaceae bacterium]